MATSLEKKGSWEGVRGEGRGRMQGRRRGEIGEVWRRLQSLLYPKLAKINTAKEEEEEK